MNLPPLLPYDDPTKHKEEDDEDDFLEDAAAMPAQAATGLSKGVKVGRRTP